MSVKITVNPKAAQELAKQIESNLKKRGVKGKISGVDVKKLQKELNKLGK